tara:strand:- start:2374 stop:3117 length:744 start_codon:yes stop_codon:yes gene_type:complete
MTKLQMLELFAKNHPNLNARQAELYIEIAADTLCQETGINKQTFLINSVAGTRWYDLSDSIIKINKVYFNDVKIPRLLGDPLIDDDEFSGPSDSADSALSTPTANAENKRFWMISDYDSSSTNSKNKRIGILEKVTNAITRDGRTSNFQSCSVTGTSNIRIYAETICTRFVADEDATSEIVGPLLNVPKQFHDILLSGAIARGYKDPESMNADLLAFYDAEFKTGIKKIKRFERTKTSTGFIKPQDF